MNDSKELLRPRRRLARLISTPPLYGTFAEIGAGQEVARESSTPARIGNYRQVDISLRHGVQRAIYGKAPTICVPPKRLKLMLDHEYELLAGPPFGDSGRPNEILSSSRTRFQPSLQGHERGPRLAGDSISD